MEQTLTVLSHIVEAEMELEEQAIYSAAELLYRCVRLYRSLQPMYYRYNVAAVVRSVLHINHKLSSRLSTLVASEALDAASLINDAANEAVLVSQPLTIPYHCSSCIVRLSYNFSDVIAVHPRYGEHRERPGC